MAKQQQSSGEPKAPLIVALSFFVLASLVLGVLYYMENEKKNTAVEEAKKANTEKSNADKLKSEEQEKVRMYRVAIGIGSAEELAALGTGTTAKAEFDKLKADLAGKMKGLNDKRRTMLVGNNPAALDTKDTDLLAWQGMAEGKPTTAPELTLADAVVKAIASQLLATSKQATGEAALATATASYQAREKEAQAAKANLDAVAAKVQADGKEATDKQAKETADIRKTFTDKTNEYTKSVDTLKEENTQTGIRLNEAQNKVTGQARQLDEAADKADAKEDPFRLQKPLGKIYRRERGDSKTVYIDLGSADNVTIGLRFTVQPANTPEVGVSGRLRPRLTPSGRPAVGSDGQPQYDMVPKGRIEVVEVIGEKQSRCRITSETDPVRERIEFGDLLYNTSWRRGKTDTVVLYGVFDANGDGIDDITTVVRDLQRMNIVVAAYFDLQTRKWVDPVTGRPTAVTEQVVYAIEGAYPTGAAGDTLSAARSEIIDALDKARQQAKDRGVKVVKARAYFPQVGYEFRGGDVPAERINQAYNRYLRNAPPGDAPPPAPEGK